MPDLSARVEISQRAEGRVVEVYLTPQVVERLSTGREVRFDEGDDDVEFDDQTASRSGDDLEPAEVVRLTINVVDDFGLSTA
jgi:hypothetical protein